MKWAYPTILASLGKTLAMSLPRRRQLIVGLGSVLGLCSGLLPHVESSRKPLRIHATQASQTFKALACKFGEAAYKERGSEMPSNQNTRLTRLVRLGATEAADLCPKGFSMLVTPADLLFERAGLKAMPSARASNFHKRASR